MSLQRRAGRRGCVLFFSSENMCRKKKASARPCVGKREVGGKGGREEKEDEKRNPLRHYSEEAFL